MHGADGWQLSNVNVLGTAGHIASLQVFADAGWKRLLQKAKLLHAYLRFLLEDISSIYPAYSIITPADDDQHGCQVSLHFPKQGRQIFRFLSENGVVADWREDNLVSDQQAERPGVVRIAPVPLYNSFRDIYQFSVLLRKGLEKYHEEV